MYEQKFITNSDLKLFGIKIFEKIQERADVFEREFLNEEEEQEVFETISCTTLKIFQIINIKLYNLDFDYKKISLLNKLALIFFITMCLINIFIDIFLR